MTTPKAVALAAARTGRQALPDAEAGKPSTMTARAGDAVTTPGETVQPAGETGGPEGPEPTRYGDWEKGGRCFDF